MRRGRLGLFVLGVAIAGSQAGHVLAFQLRFGAAAQHLQSAGPHAYFPTAAKTAIGAVALGAVAAMAIVGAARLASGRRIVRASAPSAIRLLAVLFTAQLSMFAIQETVEALLGGGHIATAGELLLWGTAGQLPAAFVAALAIRWLAARFEPALRAIARIENVRRPLIPVAARPLPRLPVPLPIEAGGSVAAFTRRGPPSF